MPCCQRDNDTSNQLKLVAADLKIDVRAAVDVARIGSIVAQVDIYSYNISIYMKG